MSVSKKKYFSLFLNLIVLSNVFALNLCRVSGAEELVVNGGFETGNISGWNVEGNTSPFYEAHSTDRIEGNFRVYINPTDAGNVFVYQFVNIPSSDLRLRFAFRPHSGGSDSGVYLTALDTSGNILRDSKGRAIELLYSLTGSLPTNGYQIKYNLAGIGATATPYWFNQTIMQDYSMAGGNTSDWDKVTRIRLGFTSQNGGGGNCWDAFSLMVIGESTVPPINTNPVSNTTKTIIAKFMNQTATIDGQLNLQTEYQKAIKYIYANRDGFVKIYAQMDTKNLYLFFDIDDSNINNGDQLLLAFDTDRNNSTLSPSDLHILWHGGSSSWIGDALPAGNQPLNDVKQAYKTRSNGYGVEFSIPLIHFVNKVTGFHIRQSPDNEQNYVWENPGTNVSGDIDFNESKYGTLIFESPQYLGLSELIEDTNPPADDTQPSPTQPQTYETQSIENEKKASYDFIYQQYDGIFDITIITPFTLNITYPQTLGEGQTSKIIVNLGYSSKSATVSATHPFIMDQTKVISPLLNQAVPLTRFAVWGDSMQYYLQMAGGTVELHVVDPDNLLAQDDYVWIATGAKELVINPISKITETKDSKLIFLFASTRNGQITTATGQIIMWQYDIGKLEVNPKLEATIKLVKTPRGNLSYKIVDSDQKLIAGASLSSKSTPGQQVQLIGNSNSEGQINFDGLIAGTYTIEIKKEGFSTLTENIIINDGQTIEKTATLSIAGIPGYSTEAIIIGIVIVIAFITMQKQHKNFACARR